MRCVAERQADEAKAHPFMYLRMYLWGRIVQDHNNRTPKEKNIYMYIYIEGRNSWRRKKQ